MQLEGLARVSNPGRRDRVYADDRGVGVGCDGPAELASSSILPRFVMVPAFGGVLTFVATSSTRRCFFCHFWITNGFSKKPENLWAAVAFHFAHYNFVRIHGSLRVTPAMAAGVTDRLWEIGELVELAENPN